MFNKEKLIEMAKEFQKKAYTPYSKFRVGAAIYTEDGKYYGGCNIESASYGATNCAERVAIQNAVSSGSKKILYLAVIGDAPETFPCGICRQVIKEFGKEAKIYLINHDDSIKEYSIDELLPHAFTGEDLDV